VNGVDVIPSRVVEMRGEIVERVNSRDQLQPWPFYSRFRTQRVR
jgi:hypothetical protein